MHLSKKFSVALLSLLTMFSMSFSASASHRHIQRHVHITAVNHKKSSKQYRSQSNPWIIHVVRRHIHHHIHVQHSAAVTNVNSHKHISNNWFRDGLNNRNFHARSWVSWHESGHRWNILSYGGHCIGYFQLSPQYLGYVNGHVNLNHQHQVQVADNYAHTRYGNWVNAKSFWQVHHWY